MKRHRADRDGWPARWRAERPRSGRFVEEIADLCGHASASVTVSVYRYELRPVLLTGAAAVDQIVAVAPATTMAGRPVSHLGCERGHLMIAEMASWLCWDDRS